MPDALVTVLVAVIAAIVGGGGGGFVVSRYRAHTEREQILATAAQAATEVALRAWQDLAGERERESCSLRERVAIVEVRLTDTEDRLRVTEKALRAEQDRNTDLERKIKALEQERESWRRERLSLTKRIAELEGCR